MNSIPLENYSSYIMLYTPQEIQLDPNGMFIVSVSMDT